MGISRFLLPCLSCGLALMPLLAAETPSFEGHIHEANQLLDRGQLSDALAAVKAAVKLDTNRFEAPFLAAVIFHQLRQSQPARLALDAALALAPADKKAKLESLRQELTTQETSETTSVAPAAAPQLTGAARRHFDALTLIVEEADKATLDTERKNLLSEFLEKSESFVQENPDHMAIWLLRALAALELGRERSAREADRELFRLGAEKVDEPKTRQVLALLQRKGWLASGLAAMDHQVEAKRQSALRAMEVEKRRQEEEAAAQQLMGRFVGTFVSDWVPVSGSRNRFRQISLTISSNKNIRVFSRYRDRPGAKIESSHLPDMGWDQVSIDRENKELVTDAPGWRLRLDESNNVLTLTLPDDVRRSVQGTFGDLGSQLRRER
ncbi:MAG: hypothetical protein JNK85_13565 [Verrucomicrobiales bacterium]|nr:hypothetical protein [Verrucomicrobiales bacterium]